MYESKNAYFFFFNDTATTEIYTLSLHDALPIFRRRELVGWWSGGSATPEQVDGCAGPGCGAGSSSVSGRWLPDHLDRKSTRLNSSHANISYAVFCLKKKNITQHTLTTSRHTMLS